MSRAIRLSKIHALNWYGYRDSLPVKGNLVLAGVTGSGKSILMDLLMLVLVGPEKAHHHFNRSATGSRSDRTIKGYCLLDTKREENGQAQYFHDKGVTTYIAAEFTWPDGSKVETWGLRFEFRNTSENDGVTTPFFIPRALERDDFLTLSPEDGKSRPRPLPDFKAFVAEQEGRTFATSREYLRDMANGSHLNFNKDVLERLLPSAMSFTNLKSFDDFCRRFVLPGEAVPVEDVVASYRDFEAYERELLELRKQLERLLKIRELGNTLHGAERDRDVARYLTAEMAWEQAAADVVSIETRLAELKLAWADDETRLKELDELVKEGGERRDHLQSLLNESAEGRLYQKLSADGRMKGDEIERLNKILTGIENGIGQRLKSARRWLEEVRKAPVTPAINGARLEEAVRLLESCETGETASALSGMADAADDICSQLRERFLNDEKELRKLRSEKADLTSQTDALRKGLPPVAQPLLSALRECLPLLPGQPGPRALRELCEVTDEFWREAIEVAFTGKFAVVVAEAHYEQALAVLAGMKGAETVKAGPQSLIDPRKALVNPTNIGKNSLAARISTSDPVARAVVEDWFGGVECITRLSELENHAAAILPDGLLIRGAVAQRACLYDGVPFVGEAGLKHQLRIKLARLEEIDARLRRLDPVEREIARLIAARSKEIESHEKMIGELARIEALPRLTLEYDQLMEELGAIDSANLTVLHDQVEDLKDQIVSWRREDLAIVEKGGGKEIARLTPQLDKRREEASRREDDFSKAKLSVRIDLHLERYRSWKKEMWEVFPYPDVLARKFAEAADKADKLALETTGDLKSAMLEFRMTFQPRFDDLPQDGRTTAGYEKLLLKIEDANIPDYERKSAAARKHWENLFRTQVLSRMQQALKNVENIISLLNHQLKRPIGHDRYRIATIRNPDFRFYRELIDLNSLHHDDGLFFASIGGELRQALDDFLLTLVKTPNSPEAVRLLDYRQYFDYDLMVTDVRDPDSKPVSVDKQSGKMSGGENQSPYFVAILASYLHAYNRHETRWKEPSLALVPIDEAFSKLSGERIQDCLKAMAELDLQGMFSMSSGNIPYAFSLCDELIVITKKEERRGARVGIRNVPSVLFRDSPEGRDFIGNTAT